MATFIDAAVSDIDNRLKELKEEEERLLAARAALAGSARRGPGRPRSTPTSTKSSTTRRRPGRPRGRRGGNTRSNQALELVRREPGITIPQIAETLKIQPNYLYRVMPKLTADGLVTRSGQGWHPAGDTNAPSPEAD
jgi:Winged helix-turn-helix DNA-binding